MPAGLEVRRPSECGDEVQVTRQTHLRLAFCLWAAVGFGLLTAGLRWISGSDATTMSVGLGLAVALLLGVVKGGLVLPKIARKNIARIHLLPIQSPVYCTFSVKSWALVLLMILIGRGLRAVGLPLFFIGLIYVAVGLALLLGSRTYVRSLNE